MKKLFIALLTGALFLFILAVMSNSFDPDLGWHLRFGQTFWQTKTFPYYDTATWPHAGQLWINHEWGGDILTWPLYQNYGYQWLLFLASMLLTVAFIGINYAFRRTVTISAMVAALVSVWFVTHIIAPRLAMLTPLFLMITIALLERAQLKKICWLIPLTFYTWSILHGSWVLGFIVLGIYALGNVIQKTVKIKLWNNEPASWRPLQHIAIAGGLSAPLILINPYGSDIYREVIAYFTTSFYKQHITEWVPSYYAPLYWHTFLLLGFSLCLFVYALFKKRLSAPQTLLWIAFTAAGVMAKRQAILLALISGPLFAAAGEHSARLVMVTFFPTKKAADEVKRMIVILALPSLILCLFAYIFKIRWSNDVWSDTWLLTQNRIPVTAVQFLATQINYQSTTIFNYFTWGGYIDWVLPKTKLFLDGRGTVTWMFGPTETTLEHYFKLLYRPNGLKEIGQGPTQYILLSSEKSQLEKDLDQSTSWKKIYTDERAIIWQRK